MGEINSTLLEKHTFDKNIL